MTKLLISSLLTLLSAASLAAPDYEFDQFPQVSSIREADIDGWGQINDQVLLVSASPSTKYMLVLERPDRDLDFGPGLKFTAKGGRVMAKFDQVQAAGNRFAIPNRIVKIYQLKGKEQVQLARELVLEREAAEQKQES